VANPKFQNRLKNYQNKNRVIKKDFDGFPCLIRTEPTLNKN